MTKQDKGQINLYKTQDGKYLIEGTLANETFG